MYSQLTLFLGYNLRTILNITKASRSLIYKFNSDYSGYVLIDTDTSRDINLPYEAAFSPSSRVRIYKPNEFFIDDTYLKEHKFNRYEGPQSVSVCRDVDKSNISQCFRDLFHNLGVKAYINVPIFEGEDLWGLISIYQDVPRDWEYHYIEYMIQIGYLISNLIKHQNNLYIASTDALTGLANRYKADLHVQQLYKEGKSYSLIFLDLDNFKIINDTWGHPIGDEVLKYVATVINQFIDKNELAARIGGDEFLIICSKERSLLIAEQTRDYLLSNPFKGYIKCSFSTGILNNTNEPSDDYIHVDRLMYQAKIQDRGSIVSD